MKCIIDVSDWLTAVGLSPTQTTKTIQKWDPSHIHHPPHTHTRLPKSTSDRKKLLHVNLVVVDVISAWTRKCHSNDGGHWLGACRFIRALSCCNASCSCVCARVCVWDHIRVGYIFLITNDVLCVIIMNLRNNLLQVSQLKSSTYSCDCFCICSGF